VTVGEVSQPAADAEWYRCACWTWWRVSLRRWLGAL